MQLVCAKVYLIPVSVESKYIILRAVIRFGESWAIKLTNLGIKDDFSIEERAALSKARL